LRVLIDTNIWVYTFDDDEPEKSSAATRAIAEAPGEIVVSTQVLLETYHALTRRMAAPLSTTQASEAVERLARYPVLVTDSHLVRRAIDISRGHRLSIWDAMIIEAAVEAGCDELWTEDLATGAAIRGVRVVNPLLGAGEDARAE
jgi:predicted nucleic acid-binding protein